MNNNTGKIVRKCKKCGYEASPTHKFCLRCGSTEFEVSYVKPTPAAPPKKEKSSGCGCLKWWYLPIIIIFAVIVINDQLEGEPDYTAGGTGDTVGTVAGDITGDFIGAVTGTVTGDLYDTASPTVQDQTTAAPYVDPDVIDLPKSLQNHIYLKGKGGGYCEYLSGKILVTVILVNDDASSWDSASVSDLKSKLVYEKSDISSSARNFGVSVDMTFQYFTADLYGTDVSANSFEGDWMERSTVKAGLGELATAQERIESSSGATSAPLVFAFNSSGRAFATFKYDNGRGEEHIVLFSSDPSAFFHELCHVYGTRDLYSPADVETTAEKYLPGSIMTSGDEIDDLTAFVIGWTDELSSAARDFLDATSYLTEEYLKEQNRLELFTGYGTRRYWSGTYTGDLFQGWPNGSGTLVFDNGNSYSGQWKSGQIHGYGVYTWASGDRYEGYYTEGFFDGQGTYTWSDGACYSGQWINGDRTGYGVMIYKDQGRYEGNWVDGKRDGYGVYTWPSGDRYEGNFKDNNFHGQGTVFYSNGNTRSGTWKNGNYVG